MTPEKEYKYCDVICQAARKYNLPTYSLTLENQCIEDLENQLTYCFELGTYESIALVNKIFFLRLIMEYLGDDELGNDRNTELLNSVYEVFNNLKNLIRSCVNDTDDKYDHIDAVKTNKAQYDFLSRNSDNIGRLMFDLVLFHIDYFFRAYCDYALE